MKDKRLIKKPAPNISYQYGCENSFESPNEAFGKDPSWESRDYPLQSECVRSKNGTIFDAIRTIENVVEYTKQKALSGIQLTVILPPFYKQCFNAWSDLNNEVSLSFQGIVN